MNAFTEAQARAGAPDVDELIAKRDVLVTDHARLFALFDDNAKQYDVLRKSTLSIVALRVREELEAAGKKFTEAMVDAMAHADPEYVQFVQDGFLDRCRFVVVWNEYEAINARILRGGQVMRMVSNEPR